MIVIFERTAIVLHVDRRDFFSYKCPALKYPTIVRKRPFKFKTYIIRIILDTGHQVTAPWFERHEYSHHVQTLDGSGEIFVRSSEIFTRVKTDFFPKLCMGITTFFKLYMHFLFIYTLCPWWPSLNVMVGWRKKVR